MAVTQVRAQQLRLDGSGGLEAQTDGDLAVKLDGGSLALSSSGIRHKALYSTASDPGSPADGDVWYNTTDKMPKVYEAGITKGLSGLVYANTADSSEISNTTTPTIASLTYTFPANSLSAGKAFKVTAHFRYDTQAGGAASKPLNILARIGGVGIANFNFSLAQNMANKRTHIQYVSIIRSDGVNGTTTTAGFGAAEIDAAPDPTVKFLVAGQGSPTATGAIDTTVPNTVDFEVTWGEANSGNRIEIRTMTVELMG